MAKTYINFILDKSGSMNAVRTDTIGGFNTWLENQKKAKGKQRLTVTFFDTVVTVHGPRKIDEVPDLSERTYQPSGNTALLDAIGKTITEIKADASVAADDKVLIVILTDGYENSSHEYTRAAIKDLIEERTKAGWTFAYLGATQEGFDEAGHLGISLRSQYAATGSGTQAAFGAMGQSTVAYAGAADASSARAAYMNSVQDVVPDPGTVVTNVGPDQQAEAQKIAKGHARKVAGLKP